MKKLTHCIEAHAIEEIEYCPAGAGESGWFVFLKEGCSFDPMDVDNNCTFVPESDPQIAMTLTVYEHPGYAPNHK